MTNEINFKELIKKHGPKKAIEIIQTTSKPLSGNFAKEHKKMDTFSNKTTDELVQQIEKENKIETTSQNNSESIKVQTQFSFVTTESITTEQNALYAE